MGHEQRSKQRVEKSLTDLLAIVPPATLKVKMGAKGSPHALGVDSSKKKVGRPRKPSKRRGTVPLKLRD